jgi:histidinol-phosphatase (PHP family)
MIRIDNHIHSNYSCDSKLEAMDLIIKAIELQYKRITFTEHVDLLPFELAVNGLLPLQKYRNSVIKLREQFPQPEIGLGIEIGDFHRTRELAEALVVEIQPDLVLGAVHFLSDNTNVAIPLPHSLDRSAQLDYYRENLKLVSTCDIDVLAHLGVYKRYYDTQPDESLCLPVIRDIFSVMIERGIALEINYSAYRKRYRHLMPEPQQISLFQEMGGKLFSIGSDTHALYHFHDNYHQLPSFLSAASLADNGLLKTT